MYKYNAKMREFIDYNRLEDWYCLDWSDRKKRFWDKSK